MIPWRRWSQILLVVLALLVAGTLARPGSLWLDQRQQIADARAQLKQANEKRDEAQRVVDNLSATSSIERKARGLLGYAYPGDEVFTLSADLPPSVNLPDVWPFSEVREELTKAAEQSAP
ncbi:MAG TPA: hypothetical protein DEG43_14895 [Acidimicrobiaceae bacterium]|jgi:cell division protein FtsB|nr:hypothetical protein [Acidimicrobiaceae bacterium]